MRMMMAEEEIKADDATEEEEKPKFFYCDSCGIQLKDDSDRGGGKRENTWCKDCCNEDGTRKDREGVIDHVAKDIIMGVEAPTALGEKITDIEEARKLADDYIKRMPAWEEKTKTEED